jgi:hypothetical protein
MGFSKMFSMFIAGRNARIETERRKVEEERELDNIRKTFQKQMNDINKSIGKNK